jgi:hypothetical protein
LHLTVGFLQPTWIDVLDAAAEQALASCEKKFSFRTVCPAVFSGIADDVLQRSFQDMVEVFRQKLHETDPRVLVRMAMARTPRRFRGIRDPAVGAETVILRNPAIDFRGHDEKGSWLEFHGRHLRFPPGVAAAVDFVSSTRRFVVREIPGLSDTDRLVLVTRLLREGYLRFETSVSDLR